MPRVPQRPRRRLQHHLDAAVTSADSISTSPADLPEIFIEWAPNDGPNVVDPTWVSLSPYATQGSTSRGRAVEFDQFQAGTMTVTLETFTRLFDPENAAGIYYGKLTPMRQIRVRAKWAGTYYSIFRGYVKSWGSTVVRNKKFVTTVTCADAFFRLEQTKLSSSAYAVEVLKDGPAAWFRFNEPTGVYCPDSSGNGTLALYQNCGQGATGLVLGDSDRAATFAYSSVQRVTVNNPSLITAYPFSFTCMFQIGDGHTVGVICSSFSRTDASAVGSFNIVMNTSGVLAFSVTDSSSVTRTVRTTFAYDDNLPHHLACVATDAGNFAIYVDGVADWSASPAGSPAFPPAPFVGYGIGNYVFFTSGGTAGFGGTQPGTIDEPAFFTRALPAARVAAHAIAGKSGWSGDDSGARVSRFLDLIEWPSTLRDVSAGISTMRLASWTNGESALSILNGWADTEFGAFFAGKDGKLVWRSRHYPLLNSNAIRPRATFGDVASTAPIKIRDDDLDIYRDSTLIRNPVYAPHESGITAKAVDSNLVAYTYADRSWTAPTSDDLLDTTMFDRANWLLKRFKNEYARVKSMTVNVRQQPTNWATVLDLELGDRVTVKRTPLGLDSQLSFDQIIEGIDWTFDPFNLVPTLRGSPVDPNIGNYLILDDATSGLLDTAQLAY